MLQPVRLLRVINQSVASLETTSRLLLQRLQQLQQLQLWQLLRQLLQHLQQVQQQPQLLLQQVLQRWHSAAAAQRQ